MSDPLGTAHAFPRCFRKQKQRQQGRRACGCRLIVAIIQRLAGLSMGALEVALLKFYQWVVDTAPPESWSVRTFTYLATGPFRCALTANDHAPSPRAWVFLGVCAGCLQLSKLKPSGWMVVGKCNEQVLLPCCPIHSWQDIGACAGRCCWSSMRRRATSHAG